MSSRGTLIALSVVAALLAVIVVLGGDEPAGVRDSRRVLPELEHGHIVALRVQHPDGTLVRLEARTDGSLAPPGWPAGAVDETAIEDVTATLEMLSHARVVDDGTGVPGLDAATEVQLTLDSGQRITLRVGAIGPDERAWVRRSGEERAMLVPGHAARALAPTAAGLRSHRLIRADFADVSAVEIFAGVGEGAARLAVSGRPPALHLEGARPPVDVARLRALVELFDGARITRFVSPPGAARDAADDRAGALTIRVLGDGEPQEVVELGACPGAPDQRLVAAPAGRGCIERTPLARAAALLADPTELLETAAVRVPGTRIEIAAPGAAPVVLTRAGGGWRVDGEAADAEAVRSWIEAIDAAGTRELVTPRPPLRELFTITTEASTTVILRSADGVVARRGGAHLRMRDVPATPTPATFRSRVLLLLEPLALRSVRATDAGRAEHLVRGETVDDWQVVAPSGGSLRDGVIAALRAAVSPLRAASWAEGASLAAPARTIELVADPPPIGDAAAIEHTIVLDRACRARVDDGPVVVLEAARCQALRGPWVE